MEVAEMTQEAPVDLQTPFAKNGYEVVRNAVSGDVCKLIETEFQMMADCHNHAYDKAENEYFFGDSQVLNSFCWYSPYWADSLLKILQPKVEEVTGLKLIPCYTYARIYYPGAEMLIHTDRPSCQYSATLTLSAEGDIWPIGFKSRDGRDLSLILPAGDMVVYSGCELQHWRDKYVEGTKQMQVFLHYVDANGPYADHKFDKRPMLGFGHTSKK